MTAIDDDNTPQQQLSASSTKESRKEREKQRERERAIESEIENVNEIEGKKPQPTEGKG